MRIVTALFVVLALVLLFGGALLLSPVDVRCDRSIGTCSIKSRLSRL